MLDKCSSGSTPSKQMVVKWLVNFNTNTDDVEPCGRPEAIVSYENVEQVHKIVANREVKLLELTDTLKILTVDRNQQHVDYLESCLGEIEPNFCVDM